jgi:hypothetical protein
MEKQKFNVGDIVVLKSDETNQRPFVVNAVTKDGVECIYYSDKSDEFKIYKFNAETLIHDITAKTNK